MGDSVEVKIECLCKKHSFTASYLKSELPLPASVCHCASCRHAFGTLYNAVTPWSGHIPEDHGLETYTFSGRFDILSCATCSAHFFMKVKPEGSYVVCTGMLPNLPGLIKYNKQIFASNTRDGGVIPWLREYDLPNVMDEGEWKDKPFPTHGRPVALSEKPDSIPVYCHCRGIDWKLKRFTAEDQAAQPDFDRADPVTYNYYTSTDACDSCRLTFGCDMCSWMFPALSHILGADGKPVASTTMELAQLVEHGDARIGTLGLYRSSPNVQRYFCKGCYATVFFCCDQRPRMVDLAVGLLSSPDGTRAETMASWSYEVIHLKDVAGGWRQGFFDTVLETCRKWREERGYPVSWRLVGRG